MSEQASWYARAVEASAIPEVDARTGSAIVQASPVSLEVSPDKGEGIQALEKASEPIRETAPVAHRPWWSRYRLALIMAVAIILVAAIVAPVTSVVTRARLMTTGTQTVSEAATSTTRFAPPFCELG